MEPISIDHSQFIEEYQNHINGYSNFLIKVKEVINELLYKEGIPTSFGIHGRVKSIDSILEKIESDRTDNINSIFELKDLVGLRIVLLYPEYKHKVVDVLQNNFTFLEAPKIIQSNLDSFGYSSIHIMLGIQKEWHKAMPWSEHTTKRIEVQIRTLSEHIWAETSHNLFYKKEENIPKVIRRDMSRIKALLEIIDENLQSTKTKVDKHFEEISNAPYETILDQNDLYPETFKRVMLQNSNNLYDYNDYKNKTLSAHIEREYNILTPRRLDELISQKIELKGLNSKGFVNAVFEILENEKNQENIRHGNTFNNIT